MAQEIKKIKVNGVTLHYIDQGSGTPVIFVHGDLQDYRTWEAQRTAFSKAFRFISYSRRYHYPNICLGDGSDYSDTQQAEDLAELIRGLDCVPAHIVAGSYGGLIALHLAIKNPEMIETLVLNEAGLVPWLEHLSGGQSHLKRLILAMDVSKPLFESGKLEEGMHSALDIFWGKGVFDQLPESTRAYALDNAPALKVEVFAPNLYSPFTPEDAQEIKQPTLLVCGEETMPFFTMMTDALECRLPQRERVNIPNAGHFMHIDNPVGYNESVLAFLARH